MTGRLLTESLLTGRHVAAWDWCGAPRVRGLADMGAVRQLHDPWWTGYITPKRYAISVVHLKTNGAGVKGEAGRRGKQPPRPTPWPMASRAHRRSLGWRFQRPITMRSAPRCCARRCELNTAQNEGNKGGEHVGMTVLRRCHG